MEGENPESPGQDNVENPTAFILDRTRSEVHLLLDNISANPDVTIATLSARIPRPADLPENWIEEVCEITWPPKGAQAKPDQMAKDAALLIKARDYLNGLAKPASGATIAFTLMVSQEESARARRRRVKTSGASQSPSRTSLAADAYPDLVSRARIFRNMMRNIVVLAVVALVMTLSISWYLAIGNAALADYGTARAKTLEAEAAVSQAQTELTDTAGQAGDTRTGQGEGGQQTGATNAAPASFPVDPCRELLEEKFYRSRQLRDACVARTQRQEVFAEVRRGLTNWASWVAAGPESAAWVANLLGTAVLPVLYGFLGAIASVVRTWSRKIKRSLLSPRDLQLSFQQLALGALIGACISLFIAAPAAGNAESSLLGPVALSSSAISFVAGFGVDSVFEALEALISRIFNIAPAGSAPRQESRP